MEKNKMNFFSTCKTNKKTRIDHQMECDNKTQKKEYKTKCK
jgi:hypothetical protein